MLELLGTMRDAGELAVAAKNLLSSGEKKDLKLYGRLSVALRTLYFAPNGVLALLEEVEKGGKISEERLKEALVSFNEKEWRVEGALTELDFELLKKEIGIKLSTARALDRIRDGKATLRWAIQQEVNWYGQRGAKKPDQKRVLELIRAIRELNTNIEAIEQTINARAR